MNTEEPNAAPGRPHLLRNWISLSGVVVALGGLFSFLLLFILDSLAHFSNPYIGILTYMVAPGFIVGGIVMALFGIWLARRSGAKTSAVPTLRIDLSKPKDRKILAVFIAGSVTFLLISALGSYQTYHFTESVQFCGEACHGVMKPEMVTYQNGPHARVACVECHIGPGVNWFVKSKLAGTYQVYSVAFHKYSRPIPTPIKNLRPAQETCEQCHWPRKFVGEKVKTYDYFLGDETNTFKQVKLMLKVGGADPTHGPVGGIHWHMSVANKIDYIATDPARQKIEWVRSTDQQGVVTEYRAPHFTNDISGYSDAPDGLHRLPQSPRTPVSLAGGRGQHGDEPRRDRSEPPLDQNQCRLYPGTAVPLRAAGDGVDCHKTERTVPGRAAHLANHHGGAEDLPRQFLPRDERELEVLSGKYRPQELGGMYTRCHDDEHKTADGKKKIIFSDCNTCHVILAQGSGKQLTQVSVEGQRFVHPSDEIPDGFKCSDCHNGGP